MTIENARPMAASGPAWEAGTCDCCPTAGVPVLTDCSAGCARVAVTGPSSPSPSAAASSSGASGTRPSVGGLAAGAEAVCWRWSGTGVISHRWWRRSKASSGACRRHQKRSTSLQAVSRRCNGAATGSNSRATGMPGTKARSAGRSMASPAWPELSAGCHSKRAAMLPARVRRPASQPARGQSPFGSAARGSSTTVLISRYSTSNPACAISSDSMATAESPALNWGPDHFTG
jgi:hypothetical protein